MEIPSQLPFPVILLSYYNLYYPLQTTRTTPFCCNTFLNSVPTARCCYCYGAVSPSLHTFLLFKKFPIPSVPTSLPIYTVVLPLEAWHLLENGKCLFILWVQNTVKIRGRPNIFSLQSYPWISDSVDRAVQGMAGTSSWCFRQLNVDCISPEKQGVKTLQTPEQVSNVFQPD